jgi:phosphatidate phosphatase APP1
MVAVMKIKLDTARCMVTSVTDGQHSSRSGRAVNLGICAAVVASVLCGGPRLVRADDDPALIQLYNGLGTPAGARIWGRVIEDKGPPPKKGSRWYRKLKRNWDALESDEIAHAKLTVEVLGRRHEVQANEEGLFTVALKGPLRPGVHAIRAALRDSKRKLRVSAGRLLIWPAATRSRKAVAVISDIDDTVLRTGVAKKVKMALHVMTSSAHDLRSFKHAPALFRVWSRRRYPVIFVSGSPVNLYPKLTSFLKLRRFPTAPLLLKDYGGRFALTEQVAYKLAQIKRVAELLPGYRFLLVGDTGEADPEVYREVTKRYPGRVVAIMIHKVEGEQRTPAQLKQLGAQLFFDSYLALARELGRRGLLRKEELRAIREKR